jgi:hypothetical protein
MRLSSLPDRTCRVHHWAQVNLRITTEETEKLHIETHICEVLLVLRPFKELESEDKHARYIRFRNSRLRPRMALTKKLMILLKGSRQKETPDPVTVLPPPSEIFIAARSNTSMSRRGAKLGAAGTRSLVRSTANLTPGTMSLPPARRTRADRNDAVQQPMSWGTSPTRGDSMPRPWKVAKTDGAGQRAVGASEEQRLSLGSGHGSIVSFENEQANVAESTTNFWNALKMMTSSEKSNRSGGGCELPMPESASYSHSTP